MPLLQLELSQNMVCDDGNIYICWGELIPHNPAQPDAELDFRPTSGGSHPWVQASRQSKQAHGYLLDLAYICLRLRDILQVASRA